MFFRFHFLKHRVLVFFLCVGAGAAGTIAATSMARPFFLKIAPFGRHFGSFFALEMQAFEWQVPTIQTALEGGASKGAHLLEIVGINVDFSLAVILLVEQVDQFPGGIAVEVTAGLNMQVAIVFFEINMEIAAHLKASVDISPLIECACLRASATTPDNLGYGAQACIGEDVYGLVMFFP